MKFQFTWLLCILLASSLQGQYKVKINWNGTGYKFEHEDSYKSIGDGYELMQILKKHPISKQHFEKFLINRNGNKIITNIGIATIVIGIYSGAQSDNVEFALSGLIIGVALNQISRFLHIIKNEHLKKAVNLYNASITDFY